MTTLPITLDRSAPEPLGAQLSTSVRDLVTGGVLSLGDRLPSTRALARDLGVSRSVVEHAYDQLGAEGWLSGRRGSGTFVAGSGGGAGAVRARLGDAAAPTRRLVALDTGTPWTDVRQDGLWRRAWREVSVARPPRGYTDPRGMPALREVLADRLSRTRGLACEPDDVIVTTGTIDGLRHLLPHVRAGAFGVEDPGYRAAVATLTASGREVVDLPAAGPHDQLGGLAAVYVTPAHQHPLGSTMSGPHRLRLLAAARAADTLVVEDDYDSEFRYDVAPLPALASLDRGQVAYLGTASKSVLPSLRLGWLVAPASLRVPLDRLRAVTHDTAPWPVQQAFLSLLRDGYLDRVVRAARRVYAARASRVHAALAPYGEVAGPTAGMYLTLRTTPESAHRARSAARRAGYDVALLADYCRTADLTGLVVGFGGVTDSELDDALDVLVRTLAQ